MKKTIQTDADATQVTTVKTFKASADVENFYRYINDNNLRFEAKKLLEVVLKHITPAKKRGRKKTKLQ